MKEYSPLSLLPFSASFGREPGFGWNKVQALKDEDRFVGAVS